MTRRKRELQRSIEMNLPWVTSSVVAPEAEQIEAESIATGAAASTCDESYPQTMPDSSAPGAATAASARTERLVGRLDAVRELGRSRRLRIQLPLGISGMIIAIANVSAAACWGMSLTALGGLGMALGPWLLLLTVMPNDALSIGLAAATVVLISCIAILSHLVPLLLLADTCPSPHSAHGCPVYRSIASYAVGVLSLHAGYAAYLGIALFGFHAQQRWPWLPARPPRATLISLWRCMAGIMLLYAVPTWTVIAAAESSESLSDLLFINANDLTDARARVATRFILCTECALLGGLALWPGLRASVQARLASMGEGVAAAAGIAELMGGSTSKELIAHAERTLRSVRLDLVRPEHFDRSNPPRIAYAVSAAAQLGSIDVRATIRRAPRRRAPHAGTAGRRESRHLW
jgi:hypothetical protein